ncbi:MAG: hypothetical protein NG747_07755 [Candidatus Brocadia sp.]|nr:hypothetical protein [Candidatus Brocadia sp.]
MNVRFHDMTKSEEQFERFCKSGNLTFVRLKPNGQKTPDYEVVLDDQQVIIEIKELTLNKEEIQALRNIEANYPASWGSNKVGNRIRYKIDDAKRQLEHLAGGKCPGVVLLYDTRPPPIRGISPYEIEVAMYGSETIDLHVSDKIGEPIAFGKHRFGKGKKLRHDCHTFISAVGVLRESSSDVTLHMDLYCNIYADKSLLLDKLVQRRDISLYTVAPGKGNEFRGWAKIVIEEEYKKSEP